MNKHLAIDAGKHSTKVCIYDPAKEHPSYFKFRTKIGKGDFDDDMLEKDTVVVQIDNGPVYKVGQGGKTEPSLETSKKTDIHRICTLAGIALAIGKESGNQVIDVSIGMALSQIGIPQERLSYKDFILGEEGTMHTVKIKSSAAAAVVTVNFTCGKRMVYPEGTGPAFELAERCEGVVGIIDIGSLNSNHIYMDNLEAIDESSFSTELGGRVIVDGLAQALSSELGARVDENLVSNLLRRDYSERFLSPKNGDKEIEEKSRKVIDSFLLDHVRAIKARCDTKHWPLNFMELIFVGGTATLLKREIEEVFGENVFIPENAEFINAKGFLRRMCAADGIDIGTWAD